jgi:zinc transport system ATP-binding protein
MSKPILELSHITFSYQQQKVLEDVTLTVEQGKFLGIVGPNGSGKSTLLKIVLGLISPRQGEVKVFNEPIRKWKERWRMGYVPQKSNSFQLDFPATVREVVAAGLAGKKGLFKSFGKQDYQQVEEVLEQVEMASFMDRNIGQLSGGQQQRVFIARALISNPDLLILDEPTVGIDRNSTAKFYTLLERLHQQQGLTLILVTHDIGVVSSLVDQVACLNKQLFFHGDRTEFVEREEEILSLAYNHNVQVIEHQH